MPKPPTCATCGHALTAFCPRCRGRTGGAKKSDKQAEAGRTNVSKARQARATWTTLCAVCGKYSRHIPNGSECLLVQRATMPPGQVDMTALHPVRRVRPPTG